MKAKHGNRTKISARIDTSLLKVLKQHAKQKGVSLSQLIEITLALIFNKSI